MKLHKIEVLNVNSLYGEQALDLDKDLGGAPLFLVVGPTGAGKTTLLDAVCLALFGCTPRLSKSGASKNGEDPQDPRRVMSHGRGETRAQVEFSKQEDGVRRRYRAAWYCRRARRSPSGLLQLAERSLESLCEETGEWTVLVSDHRKKFWEPIFDQVLEGMRVEEFTRAILLAQGQFVAFLKPEGSAAEGERKRARILELLTDTAEFRRIGARASERRRLADEAVTEIRTKLDATETLTAAERSRIGEAHGGCVQSLAGLEERIAMLSALAEWLKKGADLISQGEENRNRLAAALAAREASREGMASLEEHERCAPAFVVLGDERASALVAREAASVLVSQQQIVAKAAAEKAAGQLGLTASSAALEQGLLVAAALKPKLDRALELKAEVEGLARLAEKATAQLAGLEAQEIEQRTAIGRDDEALRNLETRAASLAERVLPLGDAATLQPALSGLSERVRGHAGSRAALAARGQALEGDEAQVATLVEGIVDGQSGLRLQEQEAAGLEVARVRAQEPLEELLGKFADLPSAQAAIDEAVGLLQEEVGYQEWVVASAEKAHALREGDRCPLCGSREHDVQRDDHESRLEVARQRLKVARQGIASEQGRAKELRAASTALDRAEHARSLAFAALEPARAALGKDEVRREQLFEVLASKKRALAESTELWERGEAELVTELESYGLPVLRDSSGPQLLDAMESGESRVKAWLQIQTETAVVTTDTASTQAARQIKAELLEKLQGDLRLAGEDVSGGGRVLAEAREELVKHFGDRDPREVGAASDAGLAVFRVQVADRQKVWSFSAAAHAAALAQCSAMAAVCQQADQASEQHHVALVAGLAELGLPDVSALEAAFIADPQRGILLEQRESEIRELEAARAVAELLLKQSADLEMARPEAAVAGGGDRQAALEWAQQLFLRAVELRRRTADFQARLDLDDRTRARNRDLHDQLAVRTERAVVWRRLHELIGKGEGAAFQKFAQILNLGELILGANAHLARLSERYELTPATDDEGRPGLAFAVIDHNLGSVVRPISTLSGGETFLVSMALALALGQFRSVRMPIETLLLDEGFGTLDRDTQDVAMNALSRLQDSGIQVGIISHVEGLRDRIPAQVQIEVQGDGHSLIRVV